MLRKRRNVRLNVSDWQGVACYSAYPIYVLGGALNKGKEKEKPSRGDAQRQTTLFGMLPGTSEKKVPPEKKSKKVKVSEVPEVVSQDTVADDTMDSWNGTHLAETQAADESQADESQVESVLETQPVDEPGMAQDGASSEPIEWESTPEPEDVVS